MRNLDGGLKALIVGIVFALASACATAPKEEPEPAAPEAAPEAMPETGTMPEPQAEPEPMAPKAEMEAEQRVVIEEGLARYTVVQGDNLWDIASYRVIYGNPYQWPLIYKANTDQIDDADLIYPNQALIIPRDSSASEIETAIQHARNRGAWTLGVAEETDLAYLNQ